MTQPIDRAFVEIEPDTRDFSRDLNSDIEKAYAKVDRQTAALSKKITKSFDSAGNAIERTFSSIAKDGKVTTTVLERSFDAAGDKIERVFKVVSKEGVAAEELIAEVGRVAADSTADSFERMGERIEDAFREAQRVAEIESLKIQHSANQAQDALNNRMGLLDKSLKGIGETIISLGSALVGLGAAAPTPAGLIAILATVTAIGAAIGPVIALVGALGDLIGLVGVLPAGLSVVVAAVVPLVFAFQGLGDAIKAVNDGDPEKIAEAMKKLSPAARAIVKEITGLNKVFDTFRKNVQQAFFSPIVGDFGSTMKILFAQVGKSVATVADSLGHLAENFLAFLQQKSTLLVLNQIFLNAAVIIDKLNVPLVNFIDSIFRLIQVGLPFIQRFTDAFVVLLDKFNAFIQRSADTGAFNDFVEDAIATLKELLELVGALGHLFSALFSNADDEGRDFIQTLTDMVNGLADFFESAEGQRTIQEFIDNIKITVAVIQGLAKAIAFSIGWIHFLIDAVTAGARGIGRAADAIGDFFSMIGSAISDGFEAVGEFIGGVVDRIGAFITTVVDFFKALPGKVLAAIQAFPGVVIGFIQRMLDDFLHRVGIAIGLVIFTFTTLPKKIGEIISRIPGQVAAFFTQLWGNVVDITTDGIALLTSFIQALPGIIGRFFTDAWARAKQLTTDGINAVVNFVKTLPARIGALASSIGAAVANFFSRIFTGGKQKASSAVDAIIGFIRALPSRLGSFVNDVGGRIGDAIKRMINRAISKINDGIAEVDRFLPGDLPRIPQLAKGGIVKAKPGGTIAQLAEAGEDEVVAPLDKLKKLLEGAGGTNITFGPGAIAVTFEGVAPTEQQARTVGNAVGLGIIDALQRRNIRTTVRAM